MYWMDLSGGDPTFYRELFGWQPSDTGVFTVDGQVVAGHGAPGVPGTAPRWSVHVQVADIAAACTAAVEHGGVVLQAPVDSAMGVTAVLADPTGAAFVVREPGAQAELLHKPMAFSWAELCTKDPVTARTFYSGLFGWNCVDITMAMPFGEVGYTVFMAGEAEVGGVLPAEGAFGPVPSWLPYVEVVDADAIATRTASLGGEVTVAPFDVARIGRVALLAGRYGETFAVMQMPG